MRSTAVHRAMIKRSPCSGLPVTKRTYASHRPTSFLLYTPLDLRAIIRGESHGGRTESGRSPLGRLQLNFGRWPTGRRQRARQCPAGRRMSECPKTSGGHLPNFSCELNLPGRRQMSARWGLCRRITERFLMDLRQKSPHSGRAVNFSLLGRRLNMRNKIWYNTE